MKDYDPDDQLADEVRKGERRMHIHFKETALEKKKNPFYCSSWFHLSFEIIAHPVFVIYLFSVHQQVSVRVPGGHLH